MEQQNHITYWRFREGICQVQGLDEKASEEEKDKVIKEIETKWWFCGGRDTRIDLDIEDEEGETTSIPPHVLEEWEQLWKHTFPDHPMPSAEDTCICDKKGLRYNCYITDGVNVIIIGRVCLRQFLPRQAHKMNHRRCDQCRAPHLNRKSRLCNECRFREKEKKREQLRQEKDRAGRLCPCGRTKKSWNATCFKCYR